MDWPGKTDTFRCVSERRAAQWVEERVRPTFDDGRRVESMAMAFVESPVDPETFSGLWIHQGLQKPQVLQVLVHGSWSFGSWQGLSDDAPRFDWEFLVCFFPY